MGKLSKKIGHLIGYWAILGVETALGLLPTKTAWYCGAGMGLLGYHLLRKRRAAVARNLWIAHGNEQDPTFIKQETREVFKRFGANMISAMNINRKSQAQISELVEVAGLKHLPEDGTACVALLFHMGNWEILSRLGQLIAPGRSTGAMFRPLNNPYINAHVQQQREALGSKLFSRKRGLIDANRLLKQAGILGILCDQNAGDAGTATPLFGKLTSITPLPVMLALKHQCPLIPHTLVTTEPGKWKLTLHPPINLDNAETVRDAMPALSKSMEQCMLEGGADTFWLHHRWKPARRRMFVLQKKQAFDESHGQTGKSFKVVLHPPQDVSEYPHIAEMIHSLNESRPDIEWWAAVKPEVQSAANKLPVDHVVVHDNDSPNSIFEALSSVCPVEGWDVGLVLRPVDTLAQCHRTLHTQVTGGVAELKKHVTYAPKISSNNRQEHWQQFAKLIS